MQFEVSFLKQLVAAAAIDARLRRGIARRPSSDERRTAKMSTRTVVVRGRNAEIELERETFISFNQTGTTSPYLSVERCRYQGISQLAMRGGLR